jgi:hypothetical protein
MPRRASARLAAALGSIPYAAALRGASCWNS